MGGGGGGNDYQAQQAAIDAKTQQARDALNAMFGVGNASPNAGNVTQTGGAPATPARGGGLIMAPVDTGGVWGYDMVAPTGSEPLIAGTPATPASTTPDTSIADNKAGLNSLYDTVRNNAFTAGQQRLDDNKTKAARDLKFSLFAQGLNGGSADIDQNALLDRTYKQGLLDLGAKADATRADMVGNDEQTRLGLLQSIDSGMDQGSAISSALNQMKVNSDREAANAQGTDLGDLFANAGLLYSKSNAARGSNAALTQFPFLFGNTTGYPRSGGGGAAGPMITPTGD